jgi:hypothetical protein
LGPNIESVCACMCVMCMCLGMIVCVCVCVCECMHVCLMCMYMCFIVIAPLKDFRHQYMTRNRPTMRNIAVTSSCRTDRRAWSRSLEIGWVPRLYGTAPEINTSTMCSYCVCHKAFTFLLRFVLQTKRICQRWRLDCESVESIANAYVRTCPANRSSTRRTVPR